MTSLANTASILDMHIEPPRKADADTEHSTHDAPGRSDEYNDAEDHFELSPPDDKWPAWRSSLFVIISTIAAWTAIIAFAKWMFA